VQVAPIDKVSDPLAGWHENRTLGQSLVEFALILPLLLVLMSGVLDFGRAMYAYVAISNAAQAGAEFAARHSPDYSSVRDTVLQESGPFLAGAPSTGPGSIAVTTSEVTGSAVRMVKLTVTYSFSPVAPILFTGTLPIQVQATAPLAAL
jgi:Flp pilus assembly protein TadG